MNEVPKELLTALRGVRKKFGGANFDKAIELLAQDKTILKPRKAGRPGLAEWQKLLFSWSHITAYMRVYGIKEEEAARRAARIRVLVQGDNGARLATRSIGSLLRNYSKAEKLRKRSQNFAEMTDVFSAQNQKMLELKRSRKSTP
jgi:hypothetical protein